MRKDASCWLSVCALFQTPQARATVEAVTLELLKVMRGGCAQSVGDSTLEDLSSAPSSSPLSLQQLALWLVALAKYRVDNDVSVRPFARLCSNEAWHTEQKVTTPGLPRRLVAKSPRDQPPLASKNNSSEAFKVEQKRLRFDFCRDRASVVLELGKKRPVTYNTRGPSVVGRVDGRRASAQLTVRARAEGPDSLSLGLWGGTARRRLDYCWRKHDQASKRVDVYGTCTYTSFSHTPVCPCFHLELLHLSPSASPRSVYRSMCILPACVKLTDSRSRSRGALSPPVPFSLQEAWELAAANLQGSEGVLQAQLSPALLTAFVYAYGKFLGAHQQVILETLGSLARQKLHLFSLGDLSQVGFICADMYDPMLKFRRGSVSFLSGLSRGSPNVRYPDRIHLGAEAFPGRMCFISLRLAWPQASYSMSKYHEVWLCSGPASECVYRTIVDG